MRKRIELEVGRDYTDGQHFALHDIPDLPFNMNLRLEDLDLQFKRTDTITSGSRVVYVDEKNKPAHFGLGTVKGTIISKKGAGGDVYEHSLNHLGTKQLRPVIYDIPLGEEFNIDVEIALTRT